MNIRSINYQFVAIFLTAVLSVTGRLSAQNTNNTDVPTAISASQDIEYRLSSATVDGIPLFLPGHPPITIKFHSDGKLSGSAGVNRYFGGIELMPDGAFRWEEPGFATTRMAGEQQLMDLEANFLNGLGTTRVIRLLDDGIAIVSDDGQTRLEFVRMTVEKSIASMHDIELRVVRLVVDGRQITLPENPKITFKLSEGTRFSGRSLINHYSGSIHMGTDGRLEFLQVTAATLMAGSPEWMNLESLYFSTLTTAQRFRPGNGSLIFEKNDKTAVVEFAVP
jgi:heat shock protein HslJ